MTAQQKKPAVTWDGLRNWEDVLYVKDLKSLIGLIRELKLDPKGLKTPDDFHKVLLDHWRATRDDYSLKGDEIRNGLENGLKEQSQVRRDLFDKYSKAEEFYRNLDPNVRKSLDNSFPNTLKTFEERKMSLKTGECTLVVAGEVGAGKSSFINLLLGSQLFPTDALKCTNTVCEIRVCEDGVTKEAIVFYKPETTKDGRVHTPKPPKRIRLDCLKGVQEFKEHVAESGEDDSNPYERVEVYWPFQMLSKGVVIVDVPGIEGGQNVDQSLTKYLSRAFGFIFMINTTTAGGVQPSRLGHLLKTIVNNANDFDPKAALFIGNKWEFVPETDKEDVKNDIFAKLKKLYPGIRHSQMHYMSVLKALTVFNTHHARIAEHNQLLLKIERLVPVCLRQGLSSNYWWLSSFLARSEYLLRVFNYTFANESNDLEQKRCSLKEKIQRLRKNTDECIKKLREKVEFDIFKITQAIKTHLQSRECLDRVCDWRETTELPKPKKGWKCSAYEASVAISKRITEVLDDWEKSNKVLGQMETEILGVFSKELGLMEDQLQLLEENLVKNKSKELLQTMRTAPVKRLFGKSKQTKVQTTYQTLGGAIGVVGTLDLDKKETKHIYKHYDDKNKDKCEIMAEGSVLYVKNILECKNLHERLKKYFAKFFRAIDDAAERIPSFLQADEQLIETINHQIQVGTKQREVLPQLALKCSEMMGELDIYYVNWIMSFDFQLDGDIRCSFNDESFLGAGNFADVHKGDLKKKNLSVALKRNKDVVAKGNISDILTEDRIMRDLRHKNVVRYYGSAHKKGSRGIQWIMVMELCTTSLKFIYIEDTRKDAPVPGRYPQDHPNRGMAVRRVVSDACQMSEALEYIHDKGYAHRDMKLENVLLGTDGQIKITDVGVSKKINIMARTCAGSPAYMAPEVLLGTENHTEKIDIYSTCFIFWEMWFGKDIVLDMNTVILSGDNHGDAMSLLKEKQASKNGFRPDLKRANGPPETMVKMLQRGWDSRPEVRPKAKEFVQMFKELAKHI